MRMRIGIKSSQSKAEQVSAERLLNLYAEPADGVSEVVVFSVPGLTDFSTCGDGPIRGMIRFNNTLFVVSGDRLYEVLNNGDAQRKGGIIGGTGLVGMAASLTQLIITTGAPCAWLDTYFLFGPGVGAGYRYLGVGVSEIDDPEFNAITNSNQWFISRAGDGTSYDALDFASAESSPDDLLRVFVDHREVLLFGGETVETWTNTGNADFPFERVGGAISEKGIASQWAVDQIDNTVFWLDQDGIARRMADGYNAQRISTHDVETQIAKGTLSDSYAFAYVWQGHEFFSLTVPGAGTYVYDAATQLWHERGSDGSVWRVCCHADVYGNQYVGNSSTGAVYRLDDTNYTENGEILLGEMIFPPISQDGRRFRVQQLQLDIMEGDPASVMLRLSNDGQTWRSQEVGSTGVTGQRSYRAIWRRLGQHRNLHVRFSITDPAERAIYAAYAEIAPDES